LLGGIFLYYYTANWGINSKMVHNLYGLFDIADLLGRQAEQTQFFSGCVKGRSSGGAD
jgi:hypothetical protein